MRDALGAALPVGVPEAFTEPVPDPLGDLVSRYARTHGPFHAADVAARLGLGVAVVAAALARLATAGRLVQGEFRPGGVGTEWCDAEVLRTLRRRSLAALRKEVEPVPPDALARFLPAWQGVGARSSRGVDGVLRAVEQLAGVPVPASALESLVLPAPRRRLLPGAARRADPGRRGRVDRRRRAGRQRRLGRAGTGRARAAAAAAARPGRRAARRDPARRARPGVGAVLPGAGRSRRSTGVVRRRRQPRRCGTWSGPARSPTTRSRRCARASTAGPAPRTPAGRARRAPATAATAAWPASRPRSASRTGAPYSMAGRWSALPAARRRPDPARARRGRGAARPVRPGHPRRGRRPSGSPAASPRVYPVLKAAEESGRARRGYFVEGLGAAQFALPGAVDRLRGAGPSRRRARAVRRRWCSPRPTRPTRTAPRCPGRRRRRPRAAAAGTSPPARPARSSCSSTARACSTSSAAAARLLSFTDDPAVLQPAADALALAVRDGALGKLRSSGPTACRSSPRRSATRSTRPGSGRPRAACGCAADAP